MSREGLLMGRRAELSPAPPLALRPKLRPQLCPGGSGRGIGCPKPTPHPASQWLREALSLARPGPLFTVVPSSLASPPGISLQVSLLVKPGILPISPVYFCHLFPIVHCSQPLYQYSSSIVPPHSFLSGPSFRIPTMNLENGPR